MLLANQPMDYLHIDGINIERVTTFNFLGIHFNEHMFWKAHIDTIGSKLAKS